MVSSHKTFDVQNLNFNWLYGTVLDQLAPKILKKALHNSHYRTIHKGIIQTLDATTQLVLIPIAPQSSNCCRSHIYNLSSNEYPITPQRPQ